MIKTNLIVARSVNGVIGVGPDIPWKIAHDMALFRKRTLGKAIVMGRNTYDSIGKPLPGRLNIIVSKTMSNESVNHGAHVVGSLSEARELTLKLGYDELWVIGGERLYTEAIAIVDEMHITEVDVTIPYKLGDTIAKFMVDLDRHRWVQTRDDKHGAMWTIPAFRFTTWKRRSKPALYENDTRLNEPTEYLN